MKHEKKPSFFAADLQIFMNRNKGIDRSWPWVMGDFGALSAGAAQVTSSSSHLSL